MNVSKIKAVTFPLRIDDELNKEIDEIVFKISQKEGKLSKHQFVLDSINEKIKKMREEGL